MRYPRTALTFAIVGHFALPAFAEDWRIGRFGSSTPNELQFSCARGLRADETRLEKFLEDGTPDEKVRAASELWHGHSRPNATAILDFVRGPAVPGEEFGKLKRDVEASLEPAAIVEDLKGERYEWAAWRAGLRPHKDLVVPMLEAINRKLDHPEAIAFALGQSKDARAFDALVSRLKSKDIVLAGIAAGALGELGSQDAQPALVEALSRDDSSWVQAKACQALGKVGTSWALPMLKKLADDTSYQGTINLSGMAAEAIRQIRARERQ